MTSVDAPSTVTPNVTLRDLFLGFSKVGLLGFGGVAPVARFVIVDERRWLDDRDYAAILGIGQVLPGANTVNAAVLIGDRYGKAAGAVAAVLGLMMMPLGIVVALAMLYARFGGMGAVRAGVAGGAAAAAGLVIGTGLKMVQRIKPGARIILFGLAALAAAGIAHLPLSVTLLTLGPLSIAAAAFERRKA